jgi:hypothetical protein
MLGDVASDFPSIEYQRAKTRCHCVSPDYFGQEVLDMDARWYGNDGTMDFLQPPWNSPAVAMDAARRCGDGR